MVYGPARKLLPTYPSNYKITGKNIHLLPQISPLPDRDVQDQQIQLVLL
jgi:hypothetical protein